MFKVGDRVRMLWRGPSYYAVLSEPEERGAWRAILFDMPDGLGRTVSLPEKDFVAAPLEHCPCCGQVKPGQIR